MKVYSPENNRVTLVSHIDLKHNALWGLTTTTEGNEAGEPEYNIFCLSQFIEQGVKILAPPPKGPLWYFERLSNFKNSMYNILYGFKKTPAEEKSSLPPPLESKPAA